MYDRRAALELLGLTTGEPVTHDRLRRAYLRRLRAHPPERDPEGFRRLREAFEQLEPWARMHDHIRAAGAEPRPSGSPTHGTDEPERPEPPPDRSEAAPRVAEPAQASAAARGTGSTDGAEAAASADRLDDRAQRPGPPREDQPGAARAPEPGEPEPGEPEPEAASAADPSPTLGGVTDDILARVQAGELEAALDLADRWSRSAVDDHREVSPRDAQRWALTRELLDVAPALPDSLRRTIARGIATDNLTAECSAAEAFPALGPVQTVKLARHLGRRAPNLRKVLAGPLEASVRRRDAPPQRARSGRIAIWGVAVVVIALVRAAGSCDQTSHNPGGFENLPAQGLQLDPEVVRRLERLSHPPTGELGSNQPLEFRPLAPMQPSQP